MGIARQRLLVSIRGRNEALAAVQGGAHIADVEYPASALGTPYPLNIMAVRQAVAVLPLITGQLVVSIFGG